MAQDILLDKLSIKDDSFHLLKSLPVKLFNKIVKSFRYEELSKLHDETPGSDRFNGQIYALTLENLFIMDDLAFYDENTFHLPAKFYGNSRVFRRTDPFYFWLNIRYLNKFPRPRRQAALVPKVEVF